MSWDSFAFAFLLGFGANEALRQLLAYFERLGND